MAVLFKMNPLQASLVALVGMQCLLTPFWNLQGSHLAWAPGSS